MNFNGWMNKGIHTCMHTTYIHVHTWTIVHTDSDVRKALSKKHPLLFDTCSINCWWVRSCWWGNGEDDGDAEMRTSRWGWNGNGYKEKKTKIRSARSVSLLKIILGLCINCKVDFPGACNLINARLQMWLSIIIERINIERRLENLNMASTCI